MSRPVVGAFSLVGIAVAVLAPVQTQNAVANGDTRTLYLYHTHTQESIAATFMVDGRYDQPVLDKLNWFLRDWRLDEPTKMDPRLFDVVWETYRESGSHEPIQVVSAYRSPQTNAMLRRRSRAVAEHSQHMLGKAMDMHYMDVPMSRIREIGMKLQRGGVGYYPTAGSPFVHLDVGNVRAWPRMTYEQLARLFPDGKTVHLPSNGQPMARYEEARAEIMARNGSSIPSSTEVKSKSLLASLFGWGDEDNEAAPPPPGPRSHVAALVAPGRGQGDAELADAMPRPVAVDRAERNLPRGETFMGPGSSPDRAAPVAGASRVSPDTAARMVDVPAPPRRPSDLTPGPLLATIAPMPVSRPAEFVAVVSPPARNAAQPSLPSVITTGTSGPVGATAAALGAPGGLLAYASPVANPAAGEIPKPPIRAIALRPTLSGSQNQLVGIRAAALARRPELVAARIDRSNFRMLTSPSRIAGALPTGLGPAAVPIRQAARNDVVSIAFSASSNVLTHFANGPLELNDRVFTGPAVRALPRLEASVHNDTGLPALN